MKLSVVTINLNNLDGLKKTVISVLSQTFTDFEYIIIDGSSTDGSTEFVRELKSEYINIKVLSEPDTGIYNAMNKGLNLSVGKYVHFLNSGDYLANETVYEDLINKSSFEADVIFGNRMDVYPDGKQILNKGIQKSDLTFDDAYKGCILHTSTFTKRTLFNIFGKFNETYQIVSDTDFFLKSIGLGRCTTEYIDLIVSYFDMTGISKNPLYSHIQKMEFEMMKQTLFSPELVDAYEFAAKYRNKINRINEKKWSEFLFRALIRIAHKINT